MSKLYPPALLLAGVLGGVFATLWWQAPPESRESTSQADIDRLYQLVESNARAIQLQDESAFVVAGTDAPRLAQPEAAEALEQRLATLEQTVRVLSRDLARGLPIAGASTGFGDDFRNTRPSREPSNVGMEMGEAAFEADLGPALPFTEDALAESFTAAGEGANLGEVQCRTSVCKVTYEPPPPQPGEFRRPGQDDPEMMLRLMESLDGDYEIYHGRNAEGSNVIYLQSRE